MGIFSCRFTIIMKLCKLHKTTIYSAENKKVSIDIVFYLDLPKTPCYNVFRWRVGAILGKEKYHV